MTLTLTQILRRSLLHRRARSLSALVALTVSAAIATALLTLYSSLDTKLHHEFRRFGANIVVTGLLSPDILTRARNAAGPDAILAPFAYAVASTDRGTSVVVAGTDFSQVRRLDDWWQVDAWPSAPDQALLGQRAARFIPRSSNPSDHHLTLTFNTNPITLQDVGSLRTGGDEDSRIFLPLATFTRWTGIQPSVLEIQVPGSAATVDAAIGRLQTALPGLQVSPVRQLVEGETRIVERTHALMYAAVLLIALTVAVSVLATLSASILERRRDFALMKALGAGQLQLTSLFLLETLLLALGGVVAGYLLGSASAWLISEANFHTSTLPRFHVLPLVFLLNLLIAAAAALFPVRVLRTLQPAALLKGE